jgi:hypothetical protein
VRIAVFLKRRGGLEVNCAMFFLRFGGLSEVDFGSRVELRDRSEERIVRRKGSIGV